MTVGSRITLAMLLASGALVGCGGGSPASKSGPGAGSSSGTGSSSGAGSSSGGVSGASSAPAPGSASGEASKPAAQILADAAAALRQVHSFRLSGTVTVANQPTSLTVAIQPPRTASLSFAQGSASAAMILLRGSAYLKANLAFYERQKSVPKAAASLLGNRWLKVPPSTAGARSLTKGLDVGTLSRCLIENHGTLSVGGTSTVDGQPAVVIIDKGDQPGTGPSKLYVATTGRPLPLRALALGSQRAGRARHPQCNSGNNPTRAGDVLTFSDYDKPLMITAPAGALDLTHGSVHAAATA